MGLKTLTLMVVVFFSSPLWAQSVDPKNQKFLDRVDEGQSTQENPALARKEIIEKAINKAVESITKDMIGDAKWNRNRALVNSKVMKIAARFIPLMHPGEIVKTPQGYKMSMQMRVSIEDLNKVLQENGLLNPTDTALSAIPLIQITDRVQLQTYRWWRDNDDASKSFLQREGRLLEGALKTGLGRNYFYLITPTRFKVGEMMPTALRSETLRTEEQQLLAEMFNCQILIVGELQFDKAPAGQEGFVVQLRLQAQQASNGRVVGEVFRTFNTDKGSFEGAIDRKLKEVLEMVTGEFSSQILEAWQRGSLGSSVYRLVLKNIPTIKMREGIKEGFRQKSGEIRMIRERSISSSEVVYEVDSPLAPQEFSSRLNSIPVGANKLVFESIDGNSVYYKIAN